MLAGGTQAGAGRSLRAAFAARRARRYFVRDNRGNQNKTIDPINPSYDSYIYIFNVCGNVVKDAFPLDSMYEDCKKTQGAVRPSAAHSNAALCNVSLRIDAGRAVTARFSRPVHVSAPPQGVGSGSTYLDSPSGAFQYLTGNTQPEYKCHRLSADIAGHPGNETWSLVEPSNPSRGVQVKYTGGDLCCPNGRSACAEPVPRTLELQFYCTDDASNVFDYETVLEYDNCHYKIWLDNSHGCPTREPAVARLACCAAPRRTRGRVCFVLPRPAATEAFPFAPAPRSQSARS